MLDYWIVTPDAATLAAALPAWAKDDEGFMLDCSHAHALIGDIPVAGESGYHALLRLLDDSLQVEVESALAGYMVPPPAEPWATFA